MLFVVEHSCGEPLFDIFPVLFYRVEFRAVGWKADHFDVLISDIREHFFGEMPSCVVDDYAQFFVVLMESFEECKIFFPVDFWAQFCYDASNTKRTEGVDFL